MSFWPFKKKSKVEFLDSKELNFTQVDFTDLFDKHLSLSKDEWVETVPMNKVIGHNQGGNLPDFDSSEHEIYRIALGLSEIREAFTIYGDGVYCPICHIANIDIEKLGKNCPKCERPLLAFGWN